MVFLITIGPAHLSIGQESAVGMARTLIVDDFILVATAVR